MTPISDILTITHKNITDNNYEVNFKFNISKEACIEAIYIKFNCDKCLAKINGFDVKNDGYFLIKPGKKEIYDDSLPDINTETNFVVNKTQFNYSILLNFWNLLVKRQLIMDNLNLVTLYINMKIYIK